MGRLLVKAVMDAPDLKLTAATGENSDVGKDAGLLACATPAGVIIQSSHDTMGLDDALKNVDVIVEFSLPSGLRAHLAAAARNGKALVSGTTGITDQDHQQLRAMARKIPIVWSPNMSPGANIMMYLARQATALCGPGVEAEIVEIHHRNKIDAPSGTASKLAEIVKEAMPPQTTTETTSTLAQPHTVYGRYGTTGPRPQNEIGIHSLRYGDTIGEHTLYLSGEGELITITHRATDRKMFADGALRAARWLNSKPAGLYKIEEVLGLD